MKQDDWFDMMGFVPPFGTAFLCMAVITKYHWQYGKIPVSKTMHSNLNWLFFLLCLFLFLDRLRFLWQLVGLDQCLQRVACLFQQS